MLTKNKFEKNIIDQESLIDAGKYNHVHTKFEDPLNTHDIIEL